ncbi:MAG: LysR family transcriptional regulator [Rhizobiaceae bacterium]
MLGRFADMEVFVSVVSTGSFSGAARALNLSPSGVSKIVSRLETRLGMPLVIRSTRRLRLTAEGETYFLRARDILETVRRAEDEIGADTNHVSGILRISSNVPFAIHKVSPLVPKFLEEFPDLKLEIDFLDDPVDLIFERTDVALRSGELADSSMIAKRLMTSTRHIVASPNYLDRHGVPTAPEDLLHHNCLGLTGRKRFSRWSFRQPKRRRIEEIEVSGNLYFNNGESLRTFAMAGVGIARLSAFHIHKDVAEGRLLPVLEEYNPGDVEPMSAIYPAQSHVPRRIRSFMDFLGRNLPTQICI